MLLGIYASILLTVNTFHDIKTTYWLLNLICLKKSTPLFPSTSSVIQNIPFADYALRCITADGVVPKTHGIVMATCCHHRCERNLYIANDQLQVLINIEMFYYEITEMTMYSRTSWHRFTYLSEQFKP